VMMMMMKSSIGRILRVRDSVAFSFEKDER